jgi:hypothetical protein
LTEPARHNLTIAKERNMAQFEQPQKARGSFIAVFMAIALAMAVCIGLYFLTAGVFGPVLLIGGGVFALAAFHYVVWGWWLGRIIREEAQADQDAAESKRPFWINPRVSDNDDE